MHNRNAIIRVAPLWVLLTILSVFGGVRAQAQSASVRGFVTTESTRPLQSASVLLVQDNNVVAGVSTDGDGAFLLARILPGSYELRVSFLGFVTYSESFALVAGESRLVRVTMFEAPAESLEDVVVVADAETGVGSVRAGLQTITAADVSSVPVPGVSGDLASYLQSVPGVVAQGDRGGQVFVRGGAIDQNLATLDGFPIYYPFHILSFYSAFPEEVVDNADFYTAGFGASYGTRVSSVLDVSMRNGNKQRLAGSASLSPFISGVHVEGPLVKDRVSMILAVRESLVKTITPELLGQKFPYSFGDRFGKLHATLGSNHSVSLTGLYTYDRGDLAGTRLSFDGNPISEVAADTSEVSWSNALFGGHYIY
ncbi:MAG: TonB-dependent receptor plug domain-containing protein, partial [Rhodothermales bacterium]|nr:TonB-dependent receptor plug domain-containing protein [Rhodothermales bacterium]